MEKEKYILNSAKHASKMGEKRDRIGCKHIPSESAEQKLYVALPDRKKSWFYVTIRKPA